MRLELRALHQSLRFPGPDTDDEHALDAQGAWQRWRPACRRSRRLAAIVVAITCEEHLGLDLSKAMKQHALDAKSGEAAGRPHGADRGRSEHADDAFRHVWKDGTTRSPTTTPASRKHCAGSRDLVGKFAPAHTTLCFVLTPEDQRVTRGILMFQEVICVVEHVRPQERICAWHPVALRDIWWCTLAALRRPRSPEPNQNSPDECTE